MTDNNLKYVVYCRKSSDREDRQVLSIDSQKRELKNIADEKGLAVKTLLSESKTAYKIGREKFSEMIELIRAGKANAILTWHLTRLARNSKDGGEIIYLMDEGLLKEIRTPDGIYTNTTNEKFLMQIHFAMSKKSSDDTSDFVKRDIKSKLAKGEYPDLAPMGYLNIDKDGKIAGRRYVFEKQEALTKLDRKLKRIEKDPFTEHLVLRLFEETAKGIYNLTELRKLTHSWGLVGGQSKKMLSKHSLLKILTNHLYYGAIRWKSEIMEPEQLPDETKHESIVSKELFNKVQEVLGIKSRPKNSHNRYYPYTNYICCAVCKGKVSGMVAKGKTYYRCAKCIKQGYLKQGDLEDQLDKIIKDINIDENFLNLALDEINTQNDEEVQKRDSIKQHQEIALSKCQAKLDNLIKLKISPQNSDGSLLSDEEFVNQKAEILKEKAVIKEMLEDNDNRTQNWYDRAIDFVNFAFDLSRKFKKVSPIDKRAVFQFICYNPTLNNKMLEVSFEKPTNLLIKFNSQFQSIITAKKPLNKRQNEAFNLVLTNWLGRRDSNPRPID